MKSLFGRFNSDRVNAPLKVDPFHAVEKNPRFIPFVVAFVVIASRTEGVFGPQPGFVRHVVLDARAVRWHEQKFVVPLIGFRAVVRITRVVPNLRLLRCGRPRPGGGLFAHDERNRLTRRGEPTA